jgi:hypothetical protein
MKLRYIGYLLIALILIPAAIFTAELVYCRSAIDNAMDRDTFLENRNGTMFVSGTQEPFSGFAYTTVCGGQCGIAGCPAIHWYGEYKNGIKDGKWLIPVSERSNDSFFLSPFGEYKAVTYINGKKSHK